jgi:hypothetical protein
MIPAEVVGTPHQIHPSGQHRFFVGKGASSAHQRSQCAAKGGIESLNVGGIDTGATARFGQHGGDGLGSAARYTMRHPDDPSPGIALDDLAYE